MYNKALLFLSTITLSLTVSAQQRIEKIDILDGQKSFKNYIKNPSALKNLNGTSTSSAALTRDTDTADKLDGVASFNCDTSASGGYCLWQTNTIQEGDKSGNCEASISYKGDASLYSLRITDGTNTLIDIALGNKTDWTNEWVNYPCGSTRDVRLVQTTAGTSSAVNIGRIYYGQATNIGLTSGISDWKDFPSVAAGTLITATTTSPTYGTVSTNKAKYRYVGDSVEIAWDYVQTAAGSGAVGSGTYLFNLPASICVIDTTKQNVGTTGLYVVGHGQQGFGATTSAFPDRALLVSAYSSSQLSMYYDAQGVGPSVVLGSATALFTSAQSTVSLYAKVPCQGRTANVSAAKSDQTNYGWTSYTPTLQGFGTTSNMDCWHKRDAGDILLDCKFLAGTSSGVEARVGLPGSLQTASSTRIPTIRSAGTWFKGGTADDNHGGSVLITSAKTYVNFSSSYTFASAGSSVDSLAAATDTGMGAGSRSISFTARIPIEGWTENQKAPVLVGSVTSGYSSALRIEYVAFGGSTADNSSCTTTPCTIWRQSGAVSSVSRTSAGTYVVNWVSGTWSSIPTCTYTADATESRFGTSPLPTVSAQPLITRNSSFAFSDESNNYLVCVGPR